MASPIATHLQSTVQLQFNIIVFMPVGAITRWHIPSSFQEAILYHKRCQKFASFACEFHVQHRLWRKKCSTLTELL